MTQGFRTKTTYLKYSNKNYNKERVFLQYIIKTGVTFRGEIQLKIDKLFNCRTEMFK